jgi:hypothetical protein
LISSLMMPACTGLPPGELISSTTPLAPSSSKAAFIAATTNSALASPPLAISPLISTTAVCGVVLSVLGAPRESANQIRKMKNASQASRTKVASGAWPSVRSAWRTAAFRAWRAPSRGVAWGLGPCFWAGAGSKGSNPAGSGFGSVMSEAQGVKVEGSMPVHHAVPLAQGDLHEPAAARAARAFAGVGL